MSDLGETIFPFGKHRGEKLKDIPVGYLDWALGIELRDDLRNAIKAYLKTQAEWDAMDGTDWKEGREEADDWRKM